VTPTLRFDRALQFASEIHRKQKRKTSGNPYISHLLGVCALVLEDGGSEDEAIAALLHDAVEDRGPEYPGGPSAMIDDIRGQFGPEVANLVDTLTEQPTPETLRINDKRQRWRNHKQLYIDRIASYDLSVRRISCADNISNVRSLVRDYLILGDKLWSRFMTRDPADHVWAYESIARAFLAAGGTALVFELDAAVTELHEILRIPRES